MSTLRHVHPASPLPPLASSDAALRALLVDDPCGSLEALALLLQMKRLKTLQLTKPCQADTLVKIIQNARDPVSMPTAQ
jgi:hypothetical protein